MSEPEDVLLDGAHWATLAIARVWRRDADGAPPAMVRLGDVGSRLELFLHAAFGQPLTVAVAEPPPLPTWFNRWGKRIPGHLVDRRTLASTDGRRVCLPARLPVTRDASATLTYYRLLASQAAQRLVRGTAGMLPADPLERDLYLIREADAVDRALVKEMPGFAQAIKTARHDALCARPDPARLTPAERAVETVLITVLRGDPARAEARSSPSESLAWARAHGTRILHLRGRYRGVRSVAYWGRVTPKLTDPDTVDVVLEEPTDQPSPTRVSRMARRPKVRETQDDEDDEGVGLWMIQLDDPQEHVEDPMGLQRPSDRSDDADAEDLADSLSELPEARLVSNPQRPREVLASDDPPPTRPARLSSPGTAPVGLIFPEWDYRVGDYRGSGAVVRVRSPVLGPIRWCDDVLARTGGLRREVRRRFERLRPRRLRLGRQLDGNEVDVAAWVGSQADRQAGCPADDRVYETVRFARRDVAILLLVDVSGSTDSWVADDLRIIDVEKEALVVVADALDALADPYAILGFSGEGPHNVSMLSLKAFDERNGPQVHRRIAGLQPDRYTRMGAAVRYATEHLMTRAARHRLLLILSDGKPNDVDVYEGRYGIEDTRQAMAEARLRAIHPFCLTVDRQAPSYLPRIFGPGGYSVLHHPEQLPPVLVEVLRRLVTA